MRRGLINVMLLVMPTDVILEDPSSSTFYFFPKFQAVIEASTLLSQYYLILPPQLAEQLVYQCPRKARTEHQLMEHLNRIAKISIGGLGANKSEKAMQLKQCQNHWRTSMRSTRSSEKDLDKIVKELVKAEVFTRRKHKSRLKANLIRTLNESVFKQWMIDHYASVIENKH